MYLPDGLSHFIALRALYLWEVAELQRSTRVSLVCVDTQLVNLCKRLTLLLRRVPEEQMLIAISIHASLNGQPNPRRRNSQLWQEGTPVPRYTLKAFQWQQLYTDTSQNLIS